MLLTDLSHTYRAIWQRFRNRATRQPLMCFFFSLFSASLLVGGSMIFTWSSGILRSWARDGFGRGRVRDEEIIVGVIVSVVIWLVMLVWIWRPVMRAVRFAPKMSAARPWLWPAVRTVVVSTAILFSCLALDRARLSQVEYFMAGLSIFGGAIILLFWLPLISSMDLTRPILNDEDRVNVHCPTCGYSLIGLRDLRCPECGDRFTIDELIRRQNYGTQS